MKAAERIDIDRKYCKGCMLCQYVCQFDVFEPGQERSALDYLMPRPAKLENLLGLRALRDALPRYGPDGDRG